MAKTVLLVDDSQIIRMKLTQVLQRDGLEIIEASSGADAITKVTANQTKIDLAIVDFNMPEMDGVTLCSRLRTLAQTKTTPIFMCTTESSKEVKERAKKVGVQAWIIKPINPATFLDVVNRILGQ